MQETRNGLIFSVIIPLEFHRGQIERCVSSWTETQTLPSDQFELVVVAPDHLDAEIVRGVESQLRDHDQLIYSETHHDMGLCVEGAEAARGNYLFFTESHCWPEPDVLELSRQVLDGQPDLAGFSARSIRETHNRLSEAEADMYEADIEHSMLEHPWRKLLDQCFIVRKYCYEQSGGFDAELGHFAEWVLAARFYLEGMTLGYQPEVRVHHYYIGEFAEIEEFTEDFTEGHLRFLERSGHDPASNLFPELPYGRQRPAFRRRNGLRMIHLSLKNLRRGISPPALLRWLSIALFGCRLAVLQMSLRTWWARRRLNWSLAFHQQQRLPRMREYCTRLVELVAVRQLLRRQPEAAPVCLDAEGSVRFGDNELIEICGFHLREISREEPCRWSGPEALIRLPLKAGTYRLRLSWHVMREIQSARLAFFWNGRRVLGDLELTENSASFTVASDGHCQNWLGWNCRRLRAPDDPRRLGLLVSELAWNRIQHSS